MTKELFDTGEPPLATIDSLTAQSAKARGAYYTGVNIADFLVDWALRTPEDTVMDPSFGGGVFLQSASNRILKLGGEPARQVFGVELDPEVYGRVADILSAKSALLRRNLINADFFSMEVGSVGRVTAIVGNPPYIRYQRFTGENRERALRRAAALNVILSKLSSSWAPFVVHSSAMLKPGGRLSLVVPMEIVHAAYARPVLQHLAAAYRTVTFLSFKERLFPDLNEDTLLLLADGKEGGPAEFFFRDLPDAGALGTLVGQGDYSFGSPRMDGGALVSGRERFREQLIPPAARSLYRRLFTESLSAKLGSVADVGIGYVTGANSFFHLTREQASAFDIPDEFLLPAILRGRSLVGLRLTLDDWIAQGGGGRYLLAIRGDSNIPDSVSRYVKNGELAGVHKAFKCRMRDPWYSVPGIFKPDAFLTYMAGEIHRFVVNQMGAVAPNSLHVVRIRRGVPVSPQTLAVLWQTSLTRLSCEIEGHAMGGGMLKLEPTEAERVTLARPVGLQLPMDDALERELDGLIRRGAVREAQESADKAVLQEALGLDARECAMLRDAADTLCKRRYARRAAA
jgi:adenine-specific DNA-methyltransferase